MCRKRNAAGELFGNVVAEFFYRMQLSDSQPETDDESQDQKKQE